MVCGSGYDVARCTLLNFIIFYPVIMLLKMKKERYGRIVSEMKMDAWLQGSTKRSILVSVSDRTGHPNLLDQTKTGPIYLPDRTKSMKTYDCALVIWLFAIAWVNCSSNGKWINSTEYLRSTERSTVVLKGGLTRAGWSASHAHVTPLSALVGRNFMLEVVVTRSSAPFSSTSCRDSAKK